MVLIIILNKLLPQKFTTKTPQNLPGSHPHHAGCFKSNNNGSFLRSHDGRVIPLRKAKFLRSKSSDSDFH
jgi:hypothetical protein